MFIYPKKWNSVVPSSLVAIILATIANFIFNFDVQIVGAIPQSLFLDERLDLGAFDWSQIGNLIVPGVSIAALGLIESLLCGASAGRMTGKKLNDHFTVIGFAREISPQTTGGFTQRVP